MSDDKKKEGISRRDFLGATAVAGVAGAGVGSGLIGIENAMASSKNGHNKATVGLGELDEYERNQIIDALRAAGVEKEIHFAPGGGPHGFHFLTTSAGEGEGGEVEVEIHKFGPGEADSNMIIIEKKVKKEEDN